MVNYNQFDFITIIIPGTFLIVCFMYAFPTVMPFKLDNTLNVGPVAPCVNDSICYRSPYPRDRQYYISKTSMENKRRVAPR